MAKKKRPARVSYVNDTPVPMSDYWNRAMDFYEAYKNLRQQRLFDWARYALVGHAVELGLKSYLLAQGWKRKKLQDEFRHDLDALLAEATNKGLHVSTKVAKDIGHLNHVHDNYLARYPEYDGLTTNDGKGIVVVEELADSLVFRLSNIFI
jgi:HEPN domain